MAAIARRDLKGNVPATALAAAIGAADSTFSVTSGGGRPFPTPTPGTTTMVVVVDRDLAAEEKMLIYSRLDDIFIVTTRGYDGSTAASHAVGATVELSIDSVLVDGINTVASLQTTKGDLITFGTSLSRRSVGSNGQVMAADSTQTDGLKQSSTPLAVVRLAQSAISIANNSLVDLAFDSEVEDSHNLHSGFSAEHTWMVPGLWLVLFQLDCSNYTAFGAGAGGGERIEFIHNGPALPLNTTLYPQSHPVAGVMHHAIGALRVTGAGAVRFRVVQNSGAPVNMAASMTAVRLSL